MSSKPMGPIQQAWYRWKTLKLPWRKRFLVGLDLQGNTFWEFRDTLSSHQYRMRRIVQYPASLGNAYSEVKISPQWHQWLRHTREDPPSLTEQSQDLVRQRNLKILAAQADARWAAKKSYLDKPDVQQSLPAIGVKDPGGYTEETIPEGQAKSNTVQEGEPDREAKIKMQVPDGIRHHFNERPGVEKKAPKPKEKEDPWKKSRGGPSEEWQPQGWDSNLAPKRR